MFARVCDGAVRGGAPAFALHGLPSAPLGTFADLLTEFANWHVRAAGPGCRGRACSVAQLPC
jgi:hypothetical protein